MKFVRFLASEPRVLVGGGIVLILLLTGLLASLLAPNDPNAQDLLNVLLPP